MTELFMEPRERAHLLSFMPLIVTTNAIRFIIARSSPTLTYGTFLPMIHRCKTSYAKTKSFRTLGIQSIDLVEVFTTFYVTRSIDAISIIQNATYLYKL